MISRVFWKTVVGVSEIGGRKVRGNRALDMDFWRLDWQNDSVDGHSSKCNSEKEWDLGFNCK